MPAEGDIPTLLANEFAAGQALADLLQELVVGTRATVAGRVEKVEAVLAGQLGQVHGLIGMPHQGLGVLLVARVERDADADGKAQRLAIDRDRLANPFQHALQAADAFLGGFQADQQDDEDEARDERERVVDRTGLAGHRGDPGRWRQPGPCSARPSC